MNNSDIATIIAGKIKMLYGVDVRIKLSASSTCYLIYKGWTLVRILSHDSNCTAPALIIKDRDIKMSKSIYSRINAIAKCMSVSNRIDDSMLPQHLYFLSDDEIKVGDWICDTKKIYKAPNIDGFIGLYKVIATTDTSLGLPQPSNDFVDAYIKAYNEVKPIEWVNVDYELVGTGIVPFPSLMGEMAEYAGTDKYKVKRDKHNCITVTRIKTEWTREEHCLDMQYYYEYCLKNPYVTPMEWLDKYKHY